MKGTKKVLIVEDSAVVRDFLVHIITSEPDMHVVGTAKNGKEAIKLAELKKPDVITMDIEMPVMNGLDATRYIMGTKAVPIVVVTSSYSRSEVEKTFNAVEAGALAILAKPSGYKHPSFEKDKRMLIDTIRSMSEVKVVTRLKKYREKETRTDRKVPLIKYDEKKTQYKLVAIGVSTGGPSVLNHILPLLPRNFNMPVVVVQHIPEGFLEGMVSWLNQSSHLEIKIAGHGEKLEPGIIYFCPAEYNLAITNNLEVELKKDVPYYSVRPSVSYFFRSVGKYLKHEAIGVLLTGMGRDGAEELALMKEKGAITIVQDEESSVVHGMPGEAIKLNAHKYILDPEGIAKKLVELSKK